MTPVNAGQDRDRWRGGAEVAALMLLVGVAIAGVGEAVTAAGAPIIGVFDEWGRIDNAAHVVASWEYVAAVGVAQLLVILACCVDLSADGLSRRARLTMYGVLVELSLLALTAGLGIAALFQRRTDASDVGGAGTPRYYTHTEQIGETIVYAGLLLAIVGVFWGACRALRRADQADSS